MRRFKLVIEYDGGPFVGWQAQENGPSVQAALERAVGDFCGEEVRITGAGRTDSGVHAAGQCAHLDLARPFDGRRPAGDIVRDALNHFLRPDPVTILAATVTDMGFHARRCATARHYRYHICNRRTPPALNRHYVWWVPAPLAEEPMARAARALEGCHDFTSFRALGCQAPSPVRTLTRLAVRRMADDIFIEVSGNGFLHNQVRIITGSLVKVGLGQWPAHAIADTLRARDRRAGGPTAPARGLSLMAVSYPPAYRS